MYKIAVCDDDTDFCNILKDCVNDFFSTKEPECIVRTFCDVESLGRSIDSGFEYDLIFLDIIFDNANGLAYAKKLRERSGKPDIIFISTSKEYAIESYDVDPLYYILKPLDREKINAALERFLDKHMPHNLFFDTANGMIKIKISDIIYFEIYGHRVIINKADGSKTDFHGSLKDVETQLPQLLFVRPHRSYIVNMGFISEITRFDIKLTNGALIPISKAQFGTLQHKFLNYLDKKDLFI